MIVDTVLNFCNKHNIHSCNLLLAVSGGCDSVSLLFIFSLLQKKLQLPQIGVAHINHGLRPIESEKEKAYVQRLADQHGFWFHFKKLAGKKLGDTGIENWARTERYQFFNEVRRKYNYTFVATGHNANDQAETILMNIARGSGLHGLCGIHHIRNDGIIRPLIMVRRKSITSWLRTNNVSWFEDPTNSNITYKRNWVRHAIIPLLMNKEPNSIEYLSAFADKVQKMALFLEPIINKWVADNVIEENENSFVLCKPFFHDDSFLAYEGIALQFKRYSIPFDRKHIVSFIKNSERNTGIYLLKNNWKYLPGKNRIVITNHPEEYGSAPRGSCYSYVLSIPGTTRCYRAGLLIVITSFEGNDCALDYDPENKIAFIDESRINSGLLLRNARDTDVFHPLGYPRSMSLTHYLKKQKIGSYYRQSIGVVTDRTGAIVGIPELAVSQKYRIRPKTKKIIRMSYRRIS